MVPNLFYNYIYFFTSHFFANLVVSQFIFFSESPVALEASLMASPSSMQRRGSLAGRRPSLAATSLKIETESGAPLDFTSPYNPI